MKLSKMFSGSGAVAVFCVVVSSEKCQEVIVVIAGFIPKLGQSCAPDDKLCVHCPCTFTPAFLMKRLIGDGGNPKNPFVLEDSYTFYSFYMLVCSFEPLAPHPQQAAAVLARTVTSELEEV